MVSLKVSAVFAELDPLENYDNFNARKYQGCKHCINSENWIGFEGGDHNTEVLREIKSRRLHISQRTWGMTDSDAGLIQGRNRVRFRDSVDFSGVCFTPRIKKYEVKNCIANSRASLIRIRYVGNFYDTGAADDGDNGVVYAWIQMQRSGNSSDKKGVVQIFGAASECTDTDCDTEGWATYDGTNEPDLYFGTAKGNKNKKAMCIGYDRTNHELVFSFGSDVRTVDAASHDLPVFANNLAAGQTWHVIETRNDVENCTAGKMTNFIAADVDNVRVGRYAIPLTFSQEQWTIEPDALGPGIHQIFMVADVRPITDTDVQALSGRLVWNETDVDLCFVDIRESGPDYIHIGDGFETDSQGPGCANDTAMQNAFASYGLPVNACVSLRAGNKDHEYCAPLNQI